MSKRVLICAPIGGTKQYSINAYFDYIARQEYENWDLAFCVNGKGKAELITKLQQVEINGKSPIVLELIGDDKLTLIQRLVYSREKLRRYAVDNDYDYIFWMDTDTIPFHKNAIQRLIDWKKDVISGLYFYKGTSQPVIVDKETNTNMTITKMKNLAEKGEICEIWGMGYGCVLMTRKAFEKSPFDYDLFGESRTDDFGHCHVLHNNGFRIYFDPMVICKHLEDPEKQQNKGTVSIPFLYAND